MESFYSTSSRVVDQSVLTIVKRRVRIAKLKKQAKELGVVITEEEDQILTRLADCQWFPFKYYKN